jgi:hypothetical protein
MADKFNKQKQDADMDKSPKQVERDNFTAEEIGEASIYDSTSDVAQQMRRGNEEEGNPNDRDAIGSSDA